MPVRITARARRLTRTGTTRRPEAWAARSLDGQWVFEREDSPGTPWLAWHVDVPGWVYLAGTLNAARREAPRQFALDLATKIIGALGCVNA